MPTFSVQVRRKVSSSWGDATYEPERTIAGCTRWPRGSTETTNRSDVVTVGWTLSAPSGSGITATDQVQMPDDETWWDVEGEPLELDSPFTNWRPGVPIALKRTTG